MYFISIIILVAASIFAMYAQFKVNNAFSTYEDVPSSSGISGAQAARMILDRNGLSDVVIKEIGGRLSDHYDPRTQEISLSSDVYRGTSISAVSVATHEVGHAIQHEHNFAPLIFRNAIVPVVNLVSRAVWPLVMISIFLMYGRNFQMGDTLLTVAALAMGAVVLFHLVTLPVELDASRRSLYQLEATGIFRDEELAGGKRVLSAAALTYLAALSVSVANLIRILAMRSDN